MQEVNRRLLEISAAVSDGLYALLVLDGAGWYRSGDADRPETSRCCNCRPTARKSIPWKRCSSSSRRDTSPIRSSRSPKRFRKGSSNSEKALPRHQTESAPSAIVHGHASSRVPRRQIKVMLMCENFLGLVVKLLAKISQNVLTCSMSHANDWRLRVRSHRAGSARETFVI